MIMEKNTIKRIFFKKEILVGKFLFWGLEKDFPGLLDFVCDFSVTPIGEMQFLLCWLNFVASCDLCLKAVFPLVNGKICCCSKNVLKIIHTYHPKQRHRSNTQ